MAGMRVERLDHLGIVAAVCQEIGLAAYLDALAGPSRASGKRRHGHSGHDSEWARLQQSSPVSGVAVLRHQARRAFVGSRHQGRTSA